MSLKTAVKADRVGNQLITRSLQQDQTISKGTEAKAVKYLERMLETAGFDAGKRDGKFDSKTEAALRVFQRARGIPASGQLDTRTFEALKFVQKRVRAHHGDRFYGAGQQSEHIKKAEARLEKLGYDTGKADGVFDRDTQKAVEAFKKDQKKLGGAGLLSESGLKMLGQESRALDHRAYRGRVTKDIKQHKRLDAFTGEQVKKGALKEGDKGRSITNIQSHLQRAGFNPKRTDGVFDERTAAAVRAFQRKSGLPVTGEVGGRTWRKLKDSVFYAKDGTSPAQRRGEKSGAVLHSERILKKLGYKVKADGIFDAQTQRASRAFERRFDGTGDNGVIGGRQLERMHQVLRAREHPGKGPLLKKGYSGGPVKALQKRLKKMGFNPGGTDGVFGPNTAKAVKRFQDAFNLGADGIVGPKTWAKLGIRVKGKVRKPGSGGGGSVSGPSANYPGVTAKINWAAGVARRMGLTVTSTTGGTHAPGSYHYRGRALDVAGSASAMARFTRFMKNKGTTELFYDPLGGWKYGNYIGAIGGHSDHVHVAF